MVPVIVNAILNEHQLVIDIVAFVIKGDFHRSRLGEKQRGKILAGWVTRKMRTIAQYSIRDPNGPENQMMISEEPRGSVSIRGPGSTKGSIRAGSMMGMTAQLNSMQLNSSGLQQQQQPQPPLPQQQDSPSMHPELAPGQQQPPHPDPEQHQYSLHDDKTPTEARHTFLSDHGSSGAPTMLDYSPIDRAGPFHASSQPQAGPGDHNYQNQSYGTSQVPAVLQPGPHEPTPFYSDSQPYEFDAAQHQQQGSQRWSFDDEGDDGMRNQGYGGGGGGLCVANFDDGDDYESSGNGNGNSTGGLRVANRNSTESEASWTRDALAGLDYAGAGRAN
jgi:hypothetical protein